MLDIPVRAVFDVGGHHPGGGMAHRGDVQPGRADPRRRAWPSFSVYRGATRALGPEVNNAAGLVYAGDLPETEQGLVVADLDFSMIAVAKSAAAPAFVDAADGGCAAVPTASPGAGPYRDRGDVGSRSHRDEHGLVVMASSSLVGGRWWVVAGGLGREVLHSFFAGWSCGWGVVVGGWRWIRT
ncbi:hypothetical protein [Actinomycetospora cinnamomea]|uniref:hypothetical protein n=1 Tax=Actinomycetospora cinnamomea TaxID=663609 RepID=UPI001A9CB513|nr:hypothetical protein [Actinomycetospora cinnamomea]